MARVMTSRREGCGVLREDDAARQKEIRATVLSTTSGGQPASAVDAGRDNSGHSASDLANAALAAARAIVSGTERTGARDGGGHADRTSTATRRHARSRRRAATNDGRGGDPLLAREVLTQLISTRSWDHALAQTRIFTDWPALVGRDVAAHCTPVTLVDGELRISAESTAWATELRLLGGALLANLTGQLGPTLVTRLRITGPVTPSWSHGHRRVPGGRGPRDTYG